MTARDGTTRDGSTKLRIAGVGYLNAAPLTFGLDADDDPTGMGDAHRTRPALAHESGVEP